MHYHFEPEAKPRVPTHHRLMGLACLILFVALVTKVWVPYAAAMVSATAVKFLPADWAQSYIEATLPKTAYAQTDNKLIIQTKDLHIEAPIVEGSDPQSLLKGVGHEPGSSLPGGQGRVVISGHRFWPSSSPWATVFFSLDKLKVGETITLIYDGQTYHYKVTESWDVPKDQVKPFLAPTTEPVLTIYTCGPTPYSAKHRIGFNAKLDQSKLKAESPQALKVLQEGLLP